MNAERLHSIARAIRAEYDELKTPEVLAQLAEAMRSLSAAPTDPSSQQQVATLRAQLESGLAAAQSNSFSPAWRLALDEIGVAGLVGDGLLARLETAFVGSDLTPAVVADQLRDLSGDVRRSNDAVNGLIASLEVFRIGAEELGPGEFEIGVLIPREAVDNHFLALGKEFVRLERAFRPLVEIATGSRPDLAVRSISSSAFLVYLSAGPPAAYVIAKTMESLVTSYEKIVRLRQSTSEMKDGGAPPETLKPLSDWLNGEMEAHIQKLADELLMELRAHNEERANEIRMEVVMALNTFANRIDRGYNIEVRAGELPPPPEEGEAEGEEDPQTAEARRVTEAVAFMQTRMQYMNLTGAPILELPEGKDPDEPDPEAA